VKFDDERKRLIAALVANQKAFDLELSETTLVRLADYYDLIREHNPLLHLVAPCPAETFAVRHLLESLLLLNCLPNGARFADVGTGAGLPAIPCLIAWRDLHARLIESKAKKATFLVHAANKLDLVARTEIIPRQFTETVPGDCEFVTCRALDRFAARLPKLLKWCGQRTCLFFGGPDLRDTIVSNAELVAEHLIPFSEKRYLYIVSPRGADAS
jgi:16S rRNA (guanine527-N7)-methyltransferase